MALVCFPENLSADVSQKLRHNLAGERKTKLWHIKEINLFEMGLPKAELGMT